MLRPRRSQTTKTGGRNNMLSWDEVNIEGSEHGEGSDHSLDESTEFGSDDIYMSDRSGPQEGQDEDEDDEGDNAAFDVAEIRGSLTAAEEEFISGELEEDVELELEGDFARNYDTRTKRQPTARESWSFDFQEEFKDDVREVTGVGVRGRRKRRRANAGPRLSEEAQKAFADANLAFVSGHTHDAVRLFQEVIRMEPKHATSWSALATCYEHIGEQEKALQVEIMGAHLRADPDQWIQLGQKSRERNLLQQALYCYRKACRLSPESVDAHWEYASVCKETGDDAEALHTFQALLKMHPHNISVINEILPLTSKIRDFTAAVEVLQGAFDYYQRIWPGGPPDPVAPPDEEEESEPIFQDFHIIALADSLIATARYEQAIKVIRSGARWFQGRRTESQLDSALDDREFDADGIVRVDEDRILSGEAAKSKTHHLDVNLRHRLARARIKNGDIKEGRLHCNIVLREDITYFSELFVELADEFVEKSAFSDALSIYERIIKSDSDVSMSTVMNAGLCYQSVGKLREAEDMYLSVLANDPQNRNAKMRLAEVYEAQNEPKKALSLVYEVIDARKKSQVSEDNSSTRTVTMEDTSLIRAPKFIKHGRRKGGDGPDPPRRAKRAEIQQREKEKTAQLLKTYGTLTEIEEDLPMDEDGEVRSRWMSLAAMLVEDFREARELFPVDRYALQSKSTKFKGLEAEEETMASRLEAEIDSHTEKSSSRGKDFIPTTYRSIPIKSWLKLLVEYSLMLAAHGQSELGQETLTHVSSSFLFSAKNDPEGRLSLQLARMAIATYTGNQPEIVSIGRIITNENQFNNETLRIMLACMNPGLRGTDALIERNHMKWSLRVNRVWDMGVDTRKAQEKQRMSVDSEEQIERDMGVPGGEEEDREGKDGLLRWNGDHGRWVPIRNRKTSAAVDEEEGEEDAVPSANAAPKEPNRLPTKRSPIARIIQGSMLNSSKVNHGALYYLFEAFEIQQDDPLMCLILAASTLGRSLGRRADNRQQLITQGVAFLEEYRKYRGKDNLATQEVEYNFGRFFHQLNLGSFAAGHYEKVLSLAEEWQATHPDEPGFGPEAAYNLSLLYVLSGATSLAKNLYQRWLSI